MRQESSSSQRAIMMAIRGYSPDFPYQLFSTFGPIPGPFRVQISMLFWQTSIQWRLGLIHGLVYLLKDQVKTIIKLFFEIGKYNRPISTKHLVVLIVRTMPAGLISLSLFKM